MFSLFFFFNDTATTEIYTLSLHDALPISSARASSARATVPGSLIPARSLVRRQAMRDRKSTRLNSSHQIISYAVFCLKKKKKKTWKNTAHEPCTASHPTIRCTLAVPDLHP